VAQAGELDWVSRFADEVIAEADRRTPGRRIVCASGLSPSGPVHLGNFRELMTPHLVADEIRRRGREVVHLLSWDDYDRFRRVPAGVDEAWAEHIGKPLSEVPAPPGSPYPSWAEHFKAPMTEAMADLGIEVRAVSQTQMYTSGAYREQILHAMRERATIDGILGRYRTKKTTEVDDDAPAMTGEYFPYKPYCETCGRDSTTITAYDDATADLTYTCSFGHGGTVNLRTFDHGKLVWKVDWPMRWAYEAVTFEPSGVDHTSPGSSYVVGSQIVREVFGAEPPIGPMYAFVGIAGMAKMSSSRGGVPTAADALSIMEAPLLRWLYARRRPNQSFTISFDQEIQRLYDEWDALVTRVEAGTASHGDAAAWTRSTRTAAAGQLPATPRRVPYRTLASIVDVTTGDEDQMLRILRDLDPSAPIGSLEEARPRLDKAATWVRTQLEPEQRTHVRPEPDLATLSTLDDTQRESLRLLVEDLDAHWSLDGLTTLVYGVPKRMLGLPLDVRPTPELKAAQRSFFALLYTLLIGKETGPRLPTLLLATGADRVRKLLAA
jgi:lysyl-tRNA synthetase class 1